MARNIDEARDNVVRQALGYQAAVMGDETDPHYGDDVDLHRDMMDLSIHEYVRIRLDELERLER